MENLDFTNEDRTFLKSLHITAEDLTPHTFYNPSTGYLPQVIHISATVAKKIIEQYGELNFDNYVAYRTGKQYER